MTNKKLNDVHSITLHTVNTSGELIYIDTDYDIKKLCKDYKTVTTVLKKPSSWKPVSVYCSPSTGDLIVVMWKIGKAEIARYNAAGHHILTIPHGNRGRSLYFDPQNITENKNGDIIVSDITHLVMTERGGRYRFTYTGPPSGSGLIPRGICTDALSHILVCDEIADAVHMIDKDGQFLLFLLTSQNSTDSPWSLDYDDKTHLLWVGSWSKTVSVYRHIHRTYSLTGKCNLSILTIEEDLCCWL
jgi:hypothetical protein